MEDLIFPKRMPVCRLELHCGLERQCINISSQGAMNVVSKRLKSSKFIDDTDKVESTSEVRAVCSVRMPIYQLIATITAWAIN